MALPPEFQRPSTRALLLVALSFLVWGSWILASPYKPLFGGLSGRFSDQISHMNSARLFAWCGTCIWSAPIDQLLRRYGPEERQQLPEDIAPHAMPDSPMFMIPGWALDKPFIINWPNLPRVYPPGALVLAAPVAVLYQFTSLSFSQANRLLFLTYLLCAHVGLFLLLRGWLEDPHGPSALGVLGGFLLYEELIRWSLHGFYDVALLAPLLLCGDYLWRGRGLAALVCYCVAAFLHYRAYFFAPLPLYALYLVVKDWKRLPRGPRLWGALGVILVLGGASLYTFGLVSPWLPRFPETNPLRLGTAHAPLHLWVGTALVLAGLLSARAWMDVAIVVWMSGMLSRVYQTMAWHILSLMMWLVLPVWTPRPEHRGRVRDLRVGWLWLVSLVVYANNLLPVRWLEQL